MHIIPNLRARKRIQLDSMYHKLSQVNLFENQALTQELRNTVIEQDGTQSAHLKGRHGAPHCDQRVLHPPGECIYCDRYPEWQLAREMWRVNYTGYHEQDKSPCPSEDQGRSINSVNRWFGNVERKPRGRKPGDPVIIKRPNG